MATSHPQRRSPRLRWWITLLLAAVCVVSGCGTSEYMDGTEGDLPEGARVTESAKNVGEGRVELRVTIFGVPHTGTVAPAKVRAWNSKEKVSLPNLQPRVIDSTTVEFVGTATLKTGTYYTADVDVTEPFRTRRTLALSLPTNDVTITSTNDWELHDVDSTGKNDTVRVWLTVGPTDPSKRYQSEVQAIQDGAGISSEGIDFRGSKTPQRIPVDFPGSDFVLNAEKGTFDVIISSLTAADNDNNEKPILIEHRAGSFTLTKITALKGFTSDRAVVGRATARQIDSDKNGTPDGIEVAVRVYTPQAGRYDIEIFVIPDDDSDDDDAEYGPEHNEVYPRRLIAGAQTVTIRIPRKELRDFSSGKHRLDTRVFPDDPDITAGMSTDPDQMIDLNVDGMEG